MLRKNVGAILSFIFVLIILHETESDTCSLHSFFILERQESWETTSGTVLQEAHVCVFAKQNKVSILVGFGGAKGSLRTSSKATS